MMDEKSKEDISITQELAKKIFEIVSILDSDPNRSVGALAVALGYACALYGCGLELPKKVIDAHYEKMKKVFEEYDESLSDSEPRETFAKASTSN